MASDTKSIIFTAAFVIIFTFLTVMRAWFRITTGAYRDGITSRREGWRLVIIRWIFGIPLFAFVAMYIGFPGHAGWSYIPLPTPVRFAGVIISCAALYTILLVHRELGRCFSSSLVIRTDHRLVRTGPYGLVRHPMYSAYLLLFIGAFFISENWVIGVTGTAVIVTLMTLRIVREEELLCERFGDEYEQYRRSTGMFIPLRRTLLERRTAKASSETYTPH